MNILNKNKIIFVTATRADYGKLKSMILALQSDNKFSTHVLVTGMHNLKLYGSTYTQIIKDKIKNVIRLKNQKLNDPMDKILLNTVKLFSKTIKRLKPDLVVVHGDRVEPLACSLTCCLNNIKIAHIEGGEISGAVDEMLRHSISKLSHTHFVTNTIAKQRLIQMGEKTQNIFVVGSPDVDLILSKNLPTEENLKKRYSIKYEKYAVALLHPVTTQSMDLQKKNTNIFFSTIKESKHNFVVIYPNNDSGSKIIINHIKKLRDNNFRVIPSMRVEYYLSLLKYSKFIIGNSSSGIMEAPYYGIPTIDIGNRQHKRAKIDSIHNISFDKKKIANKIKTFKFGKKFKIDKHFGKGNSSQKFLKILRMKSFWKINNQKQFIDIKYNIKKKA